MEQPKLGTGDIQGLIVSGYDKMKEAIFLLLTITDAADGRKWLSSLLPHITPVRERSEHLRLAHPTHVNIAFTHEGLKALGLGNDGLQSFPTEFQQGMPERSRILGDTGLSAPEQWENSFRDVTKVHALLLLYALDLPELKMLLDLQKSLMVPSIQVLNEFKTMPKIAEKEHFGFRDGISQPGIRGVRDASGQDVLETGEFVLGYTDHQGELPESPTISAAQDVHHLLPKSQQIGAEGRKDLGKNGSYLVFRKLYQDVGFFQSEMEEKAKQIPDSIVPMEMPKVDWLKAKVVGRFPNGSPLALSDRPSSSTDKANSFGYAKEDPGGMKCPFGSHVRRANPRDVLPSATGADLSKDIVNNHRILRRGRIYGQYFTPETKDEDRGLYFIALMANISRQFEFVQQTWVSNAKFGGLFDNVDILVGNNPDPKHWKQESGAPPLPPAVPPDENTNIMTIPGDPARVRICNFNRFVRVKGGAYFFMPSLRVIRFLSEI